MFFSLASKLNGTDAHIHISRLSAEQKQHITLVGSKATLVFDDTKPWNEKLAKFSGIANSGCDLLLQESKASSHYIQVPQIEPLKNECAHFLHCCNERITPKTNGEEACKVIHVLECVQARTDEKIALNKQDKKTSEAELQKYAMREIVGAVSC